MLTTGIGDEPEERSEGRVEDRRAVHDVEWGALVREARLPDRGELPVAFRSTARVSREAWSGGKPVGDAFEWSGSALLVVP